MLKNIHILTALISLSLFVVRGVWMLRDSARLQQRWVKIVPHINDTVLLLTAIVMVVMIGQYPFVNDWLTAKVLALLLYIVLGTIALKRGRNKQIRLFAWLAALMTFAYIASVGVTRSAWGFLGGW